MSQIVTRAFSSHPVKFTVGCIIDVGGLFALFALGPRAFFFP